MKIGCGPWIAGIIAVLILLLPLIVLGMLVQP